MANGICSLRASDADDIIIGTYTWGEQELAGVFSLKGKSAEVNIELPDGVYLNLINGSNVTVTQGKLHSIAEPIIIEL
ncbi:hypothetical protein [Paenibacillus sp. FSL R10-2734]|uniref:hypothetical protein n=1 Tax=Paenibacillus sp. FSL R10-2734 TaxID=2954691 RepID=UPI0030DC25F8